MRTDVCRQAICLCIHIYLSSKCLRMIRVIFKLKNNNNQFPCSPVYPFNSVHPKNKNIVQFQTLWLIIHTQQNVKTLRIDASLSSNVCIVDPLVNGLVRYQRLIESFFLILGHTNGAAIVCYQLSVCCCVHLIHLCSRTFFSQLEKEVKVRKRVYERERARNPYRIPND